MTPQDRWDIALSVVLLLFALALPLSIAVAEPLVFVAIPLWLVCSWRRRCPGMGRCLWVAVMVLFLVQALLSVLWSLKPSLSWHRAHRLLVLLLAFMVPSAFPVKRDGGARLRLAVLLFIAACSLRGLYDVIRIALVAVRGGGLYAAGNMRDPQMYMTALCFLLGGLIQTGARAFGSSAWLSFLLNAGGLLVHFKRGAWFSFLLASTLMGGLARRKWLILTILAGALALAALPQVRTRLAMLRQEGTHRLGGRYVLWTCVAPEIIRDNPQGMGYGAVQQKDLFRYSRRVRPNINHLHNNVLQVTLETGIAGGVLWLLWMGSAFVWLFSAAGRSRRQGKASAWLWMGCLGAFTALMANGVVEYNFGDTEILMLLSLVLGIACALEPSGGRAEPEKVLP